MNFGNIPDVNETALSGKEVKKKKIPQPLSNSFLFFPYLNGSFLPPKFHHSLIQLVSLMAAIIPTTVSKEDILVY